MPTKNEQLVSDTKAVFNNHEAYVYVTYTVNIVNIQYKSVVKVTLLQVFPLTRLRFVPIFNADCHAVAHDKNAYDTHCPP